MPSLVMSLLLYLLSNKVEKPKLPYSLRKNTSLPTSSYIHSAFLPSTPPEPHSQYISKETFPEVSGKGCSKSNCNISLQPSVRLVLCVSSGVTFLCPMQELQNPRLRHEGELPREVS